MNSRVLTLSAVLFTLLTLALTAASAQEWSGNKNNTVTRLKNKKHNVGIGTGRPREKLTVVGGVQYDGVRVVDGKQSRNPVTLKRYQVEATKATENNSIPLDNSLFNALCRDKDGCLITLGMRNWDPVNQPGVTATVGPVRFFITGKGYYRQPTAPTDGVRDLDAKFIKRDNNKGPENVMNAYDCYLSDGDYVDGLATDDRAGFSLLNFNSVYTDPAMVCVLTIDD